LTNKIGLFMNIVSKLGVVQAGLLIVGGIGIDLMRFERERTKLQYTLDRSVLAAADLEQPLDPEGVVRDYFQKAGLLQNLSIVNVSGDQFHRQVSGNVSAEVETLFMHMTGLDMLSANVRATAVERIPNVEISLVLDISGSMKTNDRVSLMKSAAKQFTSTVLARNSDAETGAMNSYQTSLNVIPFSGQTNPGSTMFEYMGGVRSGGVSPYEETNHFPEWQQDISNVVFRFDTDGDTFPDYSVKIEGYPDNDVEMFNKDDLDTYFKYAIEYIYEANSTLVGTEAMVGATIKGGKQPTNYYSTQEEGLGDPAYDDGPIKFNNVDMTIDFFDFYNGIVPNNVSSCIEMTSADFQSTGMPTGSDEQTPYFANWDYDEVTQDWGWCPEDSMSIQYAQKDETALHGFIDNLRLHDGTGTNFGMKYALATLDPDTQPAFAHLSANGEVPAEFQNRPLSWNAETSSKYIVLMTDGRTSTQVRPAEILDTQNSDTELTMRPAEDSVVETSSWSNLQMFHQQCMLAKSMGVTIYTVALETSDIAAEDVRECASSPSHFFEVTGTEVIDTFVAIASSIQKLRLIE